MSDCRINLDAIERRVKGLADPNELDGRELLDDFLPEITADIDELIGEIRRLLTVQDRWSSGWQGIVAANTEAWVDRVTFLEEQNRQLMAIIEGNDK